MPKSTPRKNVTNPSPAAQKPRSRSRNRVKTAPVNAMHEGTAAPALASPVTKRNQPAAKLKTNKSLQKSDKPKHPKAVMTFRRNGLPPILGVLMFAGVLGLLNGQWLVAQYQYHYSKPAPEASYSATPANADPNAPAHLYIPKIDVSAPIVTDQKSYNPTAVQLALRQGVVQYGFSADPGTKGNIVIVGHSSGQLWAPGGYKFVFTLLDKVIKEDRILVDFKGKRYIYRVSSTKIVAPTDLSVLQQTTEPQLTLITCTPVGTSKNRLVVFARQVSPKPDTAVAVNPNAVRPVTTDAIPN